MKKLIQQDLFQSFHLKSNHHPSEQKHAPEEFKYGASGKHSTKKRCYKKQKTDPRTEQLYLDLGQKSFTAVTCSTCGMMYAPGEPSDEQVHQLFHKNKINVNRKYMRFTGWLKDRIVKEFPSDNSRIIKVLPSDPTQCLKKLEIIKNVMNQELGFVEGTSRKPVNEVSFIYVDGKQRVLGCVVVEPILRGYPVIQEPKRDENKKQDSEECTKKASSCRSALGDNRNLDSSIRYRNTAIEAQCGIHRIWVHEQQRRQGIATRLMDAVRSNFLYGTLIRKDQCAFTQPTSSGKQFFASYCGTETFLVYPSGQEAFLEKELD